MKTGLARAASRGTHSSRSTPYAVTETFARTCLTSRRSRRSAAAPAPTATFLPAWALEGGIEVMRRLLAEPAGGAVQMIFCSMAEDDVQMVMRHPAVAIASDGWTLHPTAGGKPHPRSYGTSARVLGKYVREEGVLALEEAGIGTCAALPTLGPR